MKLLVSCCEVGMMPTNCYVVQDLDTKQGLVVDPGFYDVALAQTLARLEIRQLSYILLTHGHHDHILGLRLLKENFGGKVVMHTLEEPFLTDDRFAYRQSCADAAICPPHCRAGRRAAHIPRPWRGDDACP